MYKKFSTNNKVLTGFGILMALILLTALASYLSFREFERIDDSKTLVDKGVKDLFRIRLKEKDYLNTGEREDSLLVDGMLLALIEFTDYAYFLDRDSTSFKKKEEIREQLFNYRKIFQTYADLTNLKKLMQDSMAFSTETAITQINNFRNDLQEQLRAELEISKLNEDDKLARADDANRIIKMILESRRLEKNYDLYGQEHFRESALDNIAKIEKLAQNLRSGFTRETSKEQAESIIHALSSYKIIMDELSGIDKQKSMAGSRMDDNARQLEMHVNELRGNLKEQYQNLVAQTAPSEILQDKLRKSDDANRIMQWILKARKEEKNLQIKNDPLYYNKADSMINNVIRLTIDLNERFQSEDNRQHSEKILLLSVEYQSALKDYLELYQSRTSRQVELVNSARIVENLAREIRTVLKAELAMIRESSDLYAMDRLSKADEASELLRMGLETGLEIDRYILSDGDSVIKNNTFFLIDNILLRARTLESRFNNPSNSLQISIFKREVELSKEILDRFAKATELQKQSRQQLVLDGEDVLVINELFQSEMEEQMRKTKRSANTLTLLASFFALILGTLFTIIIIREVKRDLSRLIITEQGLRSSEQHLKTILNTAYEGFVFIDKGLLVLDVNPVMCDLLQRKREEVIGKNFIEFVDSNSRETFQEQKALRKKGFQGSYELSFSQPDGSTIPCLLNASPYTKDGQITGSFAMVKDISEFKSLEKQLKVSRDRAESATNAKSNFLARMSHEIRTPLNAIIGLTYLTLHTQLEPKLRDRLRKIHSSGQSLLVIINDILDFSKIEADRIELEQVEFDLEEIFLEVSEMLSVKAQEKNLELILDIPLEVPTMLKGDPFRLKQIFINLVNNAIKFTDQGEIILKASLADADESRIKMQFSVKDTGIGIKEDELGKLFQKFTQADISTTRSYGGTGLGLAICKKLTELMEGEIWVESTYGKGSTFFFTAFLDLPPVQQNLEILDPSEFSGNRVLVSDAVDSSREVLMHALEAFHMDVVSVSSSNAALKILEHPQGKSIRLIIADWNTLEDSDTQSLEKISEIVLLDDKKLITAIPAFKYEKYKESDYYVKDSATLQKPYTYSALFNIILSTLGKEILIDDKDLYYQANEELENWGKGAKILLVEDHPLNQEVIIGLLEPSGILIETVNNGKMALDRIQSSSHKNKYDLILMDLQMPVMDGYTATRKIRAQKGFEELPIIALTADAISGVKERCKEAGMNDFIAKPIIPVEFFKIIAHWIGPKKNIHPEMKANRNADLQDISIPDFSHINSEHGLLSLDGNRTLYLKLLKRFQQTYFDLPGIIHRLIQKEAHEEAERMIHTLKGISGTIGATGLLEKASLLNEKQRAEQKTVIGEELEALINETRLVINEIQLKLPDEDEIRESIAVGDSDISLFISKLEKLIPLLESGDFSSVEMVESIISDTGNEHLHRRMLEISEFTSAYNFADALEATLNLKNDLPSKSH